MRKQCLQISNGILQMDNLKAVDKLLHLSVISYIIVYLLIERKKAKFVRVFHHCHSQSSKGCMEGYPSTHFVPETRHHALF
jgi:hypothetical protein